MLFPENLFPNPSDFFIPGLIPEIRLSSMPHPEGRLSSDDQFTMGGGEVFSSVFLDQSCSLRPSQTQTSSFFPYIGLLRRPEG